MMRLALAVVCLLALGGCGRVDSPASMEPAMATNGAAEAPHKPLPSPPAWLQQAGVSPELACYLDTVEGAQRDGDTWSASKRNSLRVLGWAVELDVAQQRDAHLELRGPDSTRLFVKAERSDRNDVSGAPRFAAKKPLLAGVEASVSLAGVPAGRYELGLVVGDEGHAVYCPLGIQNALIVK